MELKVIGTGCETCSQLYENTKEAVARLALDVEVEKVEDLIEIVRLQVTGLPAIWVDGQFIAAGEVLETDVIMERLRQVSGPLGPRHP